ncbi:MAG: lmo0937 family membrane protein [Bacteroidota bacterium]
MQILFGFITSTMGGFIHILLVIAIVVVLFNIMSGQKLVRVFLGGRCGKSKREIIYN